MNHKYFIKEDYKHRKINKTLDENREINYWDTTRINASLFYQYHVYNYVKNKIIQMNSNNVSVIDIGCGVSTKLMKLIYPITKNVSAIDQEGPINFCKKKFKLTQANFLVDNFEKPALKKYSSKHIIICCDVIEHLENPNVLLDYIKKFANKESLIYISTPERDNMRGVDNYESPQEDHVREWNSKEFKEYLDSQGFEVKKQIILPGLKFTFKYPFIVEYISKFLRGTINSNQLVICKLK